MSMQIPWPFLASTHLAKLISDCKHPAPCMTQPACDALAAYLVQAFERINPAINVALHHATPTDTTIREL